MNLKNLWEQSEEEIEIKKSPTADTRTCDFKKVSKDQLLASSKMHIGDVEKAIDYFISKLNDAALNHDFDKIDDIDGFHRDFKTGFKKKDWYENHVKVNRHHLSDNIPDDVNLIDILELIADCVMAGKARSGEVYDLMISDEILQKAFQNTVEDLKVRVKVKDGNKNE